MNKSCQGPWLAHGMAWHAGTRSMRERITLVKNSSRTKKDKN